MNDNKVAPYYRLDSFDPGGATGVVTFIIDWAQEIGNPLSRILRWNTHLIEGNDREQNSKILSYLVNNPYKNRHAVVSEDFILDTFTMDRDLLSPVRRNAVLDWFCQVNKIPLHYQTREMAMSTATNERLTKWNFYVTQKDVRAAVKHGLTFIRRCHNDQELRKEFFRGT